MQAVALCGLDRMDSTHLLDPQLHEYLPVDDLVALGAFIVREHVFANDESAYVKEVLSAAAMTFTGATDWR